MATERPSIDTELMMPGPVLVENEYSVSQRAEADYSNANITISITGVPTKVDELIEVVIDEDINSEVEPDPLGDELTDCDNVRDRKVVVETVYEEE